jgi:hypothetical protein
MLIDIHRFKSILDANSISIRGILHVGAHECEEKKSYNTVLSIPDSKIIWIDANDKLTQNNIKRGIPNCYTAVLDATAHQATFYLTNNGQSSSLLEFGLHKNYHPHVSVIDSYSVITETLSNFFNRTSLNPANYNVWNFDIQGSELSVFKGSPELLQYADVIYTEVNSGEVYKNCGKLAEMDTFLKEHNFTRVDTVMTPYQWGDAVYVKKISE